MYEHKAGIYAIHRIGTDDFYIGSSSDIPVRWLRHKRHLAKGKHHNTRLQQAWTEFGADAFEFLVLEECERDRTVLAQREQEYLNALHPVFNAVSWTTLSRLGTTTLRLDITQCPQGHVYDETNTGHTKKNQRYCRRCAAEKSIAKYAHKTPFRSDGPVCQKGHEWTPENTRILKTGKRQCIACADERAKARYERAQSAEAREKSRAQKRADFQRHQDARRADNRARDKARRQKHIEERIARGEKPGTLATCRKGHPWTPENTLQWKDKRLCRICHDAARAMTSEQHAAHLAQRRERERATWHDAYQRRAARLREGVARSG